MKRKDKQEVHAYDTWPPPRDENKDKEEEEKTKDRKPRNVNYIDLSEDLPPESGAEEPIYDIEEKKDDTLQEEEKEDEKDEEKEDDHNERK